MKLKIAIISILTAVFANAASIDYLSNNSASYQRKYAELNG